MNLYVLCSDRYAHLVPGCCWLLRKYWPEMFNNVLVVGYYALVSQDLRQYDNEPEMRWVIESADLSFPVKILGPDPGPKRWSDGLIPFFSGLPEERFIVMLEDYWLCDRANHELFEALASIEEPWAKLDLYGAVERQKHRPNLFIPWPHGWGCSLIEQDQGADYRSSLHAHAWLKDYFLKFLKPGRSPWDFEVLGMEEARNDGARILGTKPDHVLCYANLYRGGGRFNHKEVVWIMESDKIEMERNGVVPKGFWEQ